MSLRLTENLEDVLMSDIFGGGFERGLKLLRLGFLLLWEFFTHLSKLQGKRSEITKVALAFLIQQNLT